MRERNLNKIFMEYAIHILNEKLNQLQDAYVKFVVKGNVDTQSETAKQNRIKAESLTNAIKILLDDVETRKNNCNLHIVKNCPFCGSKDIVGGLTTKYFCNFCKEPF